MSLPVFPASLDRPLRDNFNQGLGDNRRMFAPEAGPLVPRPRFSRVADPVSMMLDVSRQQRAVFEQFWADDTRRGSLPFLMPDPGTDGWPLLDANGAPMLTAGGQPILLAKTWVCMFSDQVPAITAYGNRWRIAFGIGVLP